MKGNITAQDMNTPVVALINADALLTEVANDLSETGYDVMHFSKDVDLKQQWTRLNLNIVAILYKLDAKGLPEMAFFDVLQKNKHSAVPFFIYTVEANPGWLMMALKAGVSDVFLKESVRISLVKRIDFTVRNWTSLRSVAHSGQIKEQKEYTLPWPKRLFDIFFSLLALVFLSPLLLLVIIALKVESKGPIFYYSLRVGTGYRVFKFFKFRSMYLNADKRLKDLKHLNQYSPTNEGKTAIQTLSFGCEECKQNGVKCQNPIYADNHTWCERQYMLSRKSTDGSAFFKLKDDPRITKVGKILRKTSIDELPQLINVLLRDMSIVGNRPLPLYEAEKLTTDKYAQRFLAPAGITGLWQVEKRGKKEMSEEERLLLDNKYAQENNLFYDLGLIFKTVPALFQKENV